MISDMIRPGLKDFIPYKSNQVPFRIKLDANESPFGLSENVRKKLADYFAGNFEMNLYPDSDSTELRKSLADFWNVDSEGIIAGTGSNELIKIIVDVFADRGDRIIYPAPSFDMYRVNSLIAGCIPVEIVLSSEKGFRYDADEFIHKANKERAKVIFLCVPNNPTGNTMDIYDIEKIATECNRSVVVVDEAYAEFSGETAIPLTAKYDNVVVLRSFSKAYGLAGLRCGYSISGRAFANEINKIKAPYNLNSLTQLIAKTVLEEREETAGRVKYLNEQRDYLFNQLQKIDGIVAYPSKANFILMRVSDALKVSAALKERGILIRSYGKSVHLKDFIRISVGNREQNDVLLEEFKAVLSA